MILITLIASTVNATEQAVDNDLTEMTPEERLAFVRQLSELEYTPSLLTRSDREQDLFFLPIREFSENPLFRNAKGFEEIVSASDSQDIFPLLRLYRGEKTTGPTRSLLHAMLLLFSTSNKGSLQEGEIYQIKHSLEATLNQESTTLNNAFASIALSSYYRNQKEYRPALDSIMKGITLLPAFQNITDHEATLITLAANYQLAAFYYALRDMKSAADTYERIIYEGSAYISKSHQTAHTRRLLDVLYQQERYSDAVPHAERLLNQMYDEPSQKAKAQYIYGKLMLALGDKDAAVGYFNDILKQPVNPASDIARACRALYEINPTPQSFQCMEDNISQIDDHEFKHYWHKLNYFKLIENNELELAIKHIKGMVRSVRTYMEEVISRQSQRLLLEYNVDMAKKQASELKGELKLKKAYLAQNERNEVLYNLMIGIIAVAVVLALVFLARERKNRKIMHDMAMTDTLTQTPNRRSIMETAEKAAIQSTEKRPWVLSILDLDHFKQINDKYGHDGGDAVLRLFSKTCQRLLPDGATLGRYGGEEFLIIMPGANSDDAKVFFTRLQKCLLGQTINVDDTLHDIDITLSAGAAEVLWENDEASRKDSIAILDDIIKLADDNVYKAKRAGRDNMVISPFKKVTYA